MEGSTLLRALTLDFSPSHYRNQPTQPIFRTPTTNLIDRTPDVIDRPRESAKTAYPNHTLQRFYPKTYSFTPKSATMPNLAKKNRVQFFKSHPFTTHSRKNSAKALWITYPSSNHEGMTESQSTHQWLHPKKPKKPPQSKLRTKPKQQKIKANKDRNEAIKLQFWDAKSEFSSESLKWRD